MLGNTIKLELKDIYTEGSYEGCYFIFRKPKASDMIKVNQAQINQKDENVKREKDGLTLIEASEELVLAMEDVVANCYISGKAKDEEILVDVSKEQFAELFLDSETISKILPKLVGTEGLESLEQKSE